MLVVVTVVMCVEADLFEILVEVMVVVDVCGRGGFENIGCHVNRSDANAEVRPSGPT